MLKVYDVKFLLLNLIPLTFLALEAKASKLGSTFLKSIAQLNYIDV
jgi:hypothetical protein